MEKNDNLTKKRNLGGRPKGVGNKVNAKAKELVAEILNTELQTLQERLEELKPNERVKVTIELLKYVVPSLKAIETTDTTPNNFKPVILNFTNDNIN